MNLNVQLLHLKLEELVFRIEVNQFVNSRLKHLYLKVFYHRFKRLRQFFHKLFLQKLVNTLIYSEDTNQ
jgi:hypothetical protein